MPRRAVQQSIEAVTSPASTDLQRFVRSTLGCKCPDEVFQSISIDQCDDHMRLVIGNRLLIYVMKAAAGPALHKALSRLTELGLEDRNSRRLNRLRLVVVSAQPTLDLAGTKAAFAEAAGADDRAHMHLITRDQLPTELQRFATSPASKETRDWVRHHFPKDPHEPAG